MRFLETANRVAKGLRNAGDFHAAYEVAKAGRAAAEHLPPDTGAVLEIRHTFACLTDDVGDFVAAETEYRALLAIQTELLGPLHPDTLATRNHLGFSLGRQGRREEAEREYRAVLNDRINARSGRPDAGATLMRQVVDGRTEMLGPQHHDTRISAEALQRMTPS